MFHVKHCLGRLDMKRPEDLLQLATDKGLSLDASQQQLLDKLTDWVAQRAALVGLSKYDSPEAVRERLIAPALAIFDVVDLTSLRSCVDIGAGTGALGITLAIAIPHLQVDLVDRSERAIRFMELLTRHLDLTNAQTILVEAERLAQQRPNHYDLICIRALTDGQEALALAARLCRSGGYITAWHQPTDPAYVAGSLPLERVGVAATGLRGLSVSAFRSQ